jgi:hypothetical protein
MSWIKMRTALGSDPKVIFIANDIASSARFNYWLSSGQHDKLQVGDGALRYIVTGALHAVWSAANEHSENGVIQNADLSWIDVVSGIENLGLAMAKVGWATIVGEDLVFPKFGTNNTSAAERQRKYRQKKRVTGGATGDVTRCATVAHREEKIREDKSIRDNTSPADVAVGFNEWYAIYPRKVKKDSAFKAYQKVLKTVAHDDLCSVTRLFAASPAGNAGEFTPYPASWLNSGSYADDPTEWQKRNGRQRELIGGAGVNYDPNVELEGFR